MKRERYPRPRQAIWGALALLLISVRVVHGSPQEMHIMEGFLPPAWAAFWYLAVIPFWLIGFRRIRGLVSSRPEARLGLGMAAAFTFVLSALKIPSVTGSSSHPTGTGLGAILFGPSVMSVLGSIVLLFQALLLAHGGITTLGANAVSMALVGPAVGWASYRALKRTRFQWLPVFIAGATADLTTYLVTSFQLSLAYPDPMGGVAASLIKFAGIFAVTQVPLAIGDGIVTVLTLNALRKSGTEEFEYSGAQEG